MNDPITIGIGAVAVVGWLVAASAICLLLDARARVRWHRSKPSMPKRDSRGRFISPLAQRKEETTARLRSGK